MKFIFGLLVASLAISAILALPAGSPNDDAELIDVPKRQMVNRLSIDDSGDSSGGEPDFTDFKGVVDTGVGYPFLQPHPLPFSFNLGFFDAFEDIFHRLRSQLWSPSLPSDDESFSAFDPSKGNTTSTVKVVDGHKIEVNETVYGDSDNLFKVRLVNIRPIDSDEDVAETSSSNGLNPVTSAPSKSGYDSESDERREPLEKKTNENEIKRNIDEPEHTEFQPLVPLIHDTMLPGTNEDNAANLNAVFVTDNNLEVAEGNGNSEQSSEEEIAEAVEKDGNIEAETNKSVTNKCVKEKMEILENSTTIPTVEGKSLAVRQDDEQSVEDYALTIENNEEVRANNSSNVSLNSDVEADVSKAEDEANAATTVPADLQAESDEESVEETATESAGIDEATKPVTYVDDLDEWVGDVAVDAHGGDIDEVDSDSHERRYANNADNRNREDVLSSDDEEEAENVEMNPGFDSEWADLKEDLARKEQERNDLSIEIDGYDSLAVDLSNDIAVNELAAANPDFPINAEAEFIDVSRIRNFTGTPKFEELKILDGK